MPPPPAELDPLLLERMRCEGDERARENARYFIATGNAEWNTEEFFNSGRLNVFVEILTDLGNVCRGRNAKL
jgi:hypothetical protein